MGSYMLQNQVFQNWLKNKTNHILSKADREIISTEEMIILTLQAQSDHFTFMEKEFRDEFRKIDKRFEAVDKRFEAVDKKFDQFEQKIDYRFKQVDEKFAQLQKILMWGFGLVISCVLINFFKP